MIWTHKLRSFFMVIGTILGVTFLMAVVTLINGVDTYIRQDVARRIVGFNVVTLRRRSPARDGTQLSPEAARIARRSPPLTFDDATWLAAQLRVPSTVATSNGGTARVSAIGGVAVDEVSVIAASESYFDVQNLHPAEGRLFGTREADVGESVAVIGVNLADKLFPGRAALDRTVRIAGIPYRVIGVLAAQGALFGVSLDDVAITPARSPLNAVFGYPHRVEDIVVKVPETALLPVARAEITEAMRARHTLSPRDANDFEVESSDASLAFLGKVTGVMYVALPSLVGVSLIVGAVVMMNIMLVSVAERTREIGLRKSLGARSQDILFQFLVETCVVSGVGGVVGIVLGIVLAALVAAFSPLPTRVPGWAVGTGVLLAVGVGLAAGVYPAYRAARLNPIAALHRT
jgi:putative ABC transport system permease protein